MVKREHSWTLFVALMLVVGVQALPAQSNITAPRFGEYEVGDDYFLANYTQLMEYWRTLEKDSDRIKLVEIGMTEEGRSQVMAIITSPANHANLERYREISVKLARAEGLTDDEARKLAAEGKAVVWIDGGLHATECINAQGLFIMAYQMASLDDPETMRFLDDVILLLTPANPDGMELVSDWYMREPDPEKRSTSGIPRLYQKYVGHDNNRDSYLSSQAETTNIGRQMFIEWIPQIMYNQHQTGPAGTVLFVPPFRDPFNYNQDPLVPMGIELVCASIHNRFITEGKGGAVLRNEAPFSTWFNGGVRTAVGFHNQIGLLTEIIGNPTPVDIPFIPNRLLPNTSQPYPIQPYQKWHQRQSIDYIMSANRAILDVASKHREDFLFRIYRMGKNSIEHGSKDYWTLWPKQLAAVTAEIDEDMPDIRDTGVRDALAGYFGFLEPIPKKYYDKLFDPAKRDPRGYIIPSDQPDFLTATRFVNALIKTGIEIHRATSDFEVAGTSYPAGSYVIMAAQAFRPHLRDMLEPQDHPNDFPYEGGPPKPPYDVAGWTLAYQMGVQFDRVLDGFEGPFERLPIGELVAPPAGKVIPPSRGNAVGYLLSHQVNDAFTATHRLLEANEEVYWLQGPFAAGGKTYPAGTIYIPGKRSTRGVAENLAEEIGVTFEATSTRPKGDALKLRTVRVGLWDQYGGSMPSGWIRWMFEKVFPFSTFELVYPPVLDAGGLNAKYDVLVFPDGAIPASDRPSRRARFQGEPPENLPPEWKDKTGRMTVEKTVPQLEKFVEEGGTLIAIGSSSVVGRHFGLPLGDHLVERSPTGEEKRLSAAEYYVPGSVLEVRVDNSRPVAFGEPEALDVMFSNNPVFRLPPDAGAKGVHAVAWFGTGSPLRSGWAWGETYLENGVVGVEAEMGKGKVYLFTPRITFRAQPHGTFKFLFNAIYLSGAQPARLGN